MEEMTREEMQRLLDEAAKEGKTEIEAYQLLAKIIGIKYHKYDEES